MREDMGLFRGKRLDNGEWVEGNYVLQYGCFSIYLPSVDGEYNVDNYYVDPATVGEYTGLKDKNGKRVFEGDIIKDTWGKVYKVLFTTTQSVFMVDCKIAPNEYETGRYRLGDAWCDTIAVIGNITDNPELLEVDE